MSIKHIKATITRTLLFAPSAYIAAECNCSEICDACNTHFNVASLLANTITATQENEKQWYFLGNIDSCRWENCSVINAVNNLTEELAVYWRPLMWIISFFLTARRVSKQLLPAAFIEIYETVYVHSLIARSREHLLRKLPGASIIRLLSRLPRAHKSPQTLFRVFQI